MGTTVFRMRIELILGECCNPATLPRSRGVLGACRRAAPVEAADSLARIGAIQPEHPDSSASGSSMSQQSGARQCATREVLRLSFGSQLARAPGEIKSQRARSSRNPGRDQIGKLGRDGRNQQYR
jgi:hypothetical protein